MDLQSITERFNLQKLVNEFKSAVSEQAAVPLDANNPLGQGMLDLLELVKKMVKLQDEQRKLMDKTIELLATLAQKAATLASCSTSDNNQASSTQSTANANDNGTTDTAASATASDTPSVTEQNESNDKQ